MTKQDGMSMQKQTGYDSSHPSPGTNGRAANVSIAAAQPSAIALSPVLTLMVENEIDRCYGSSDSLLEKICGYAMKPPGKLFRPMLLLHSALAVGGDLQSVLPAAFGAECGHVASLIHDDIIDQDEMRRGRPSVPARYGTSEAILAGDMLIFQLFASLAECRATGAADTGVVSALGAVARAGKDLCLGQSMEARICAELDFDPAAYLTMIRLKTAAFFRGACESGALLAGGAPALVGALATYADNLGVAFQIHDDLLPYLSGTGVMGKAATSDVSNGRLTLPVVLAYQSASSERPALRRLLTGAGGDPQARLDELAEILDRADAVNQSISLALDHVDRARAALSSLPVTLSRDQLALFAELSVNRYL
jgi:geranylgeranyl diphosphate synthase type I